MGASAEPVQRAAASAASATDPFGDRRALHGFGLRSFGRRSNAVLINRIGVPPVMRVTERRFSSPKCAPYGGGPDEDIFLRFGVRPREYITGLTTVLALFAGG